VRAVGKFLPGTGRGTMRSMVEGVAHPWRTPSVIPSGCHLPVPGRIKS